MMTVIAQSSSPITVPGSRPNIQFVAPLASGQWTMPAGDYGNTRFSPLDSINTRNVQNLHVVATASTGIPHGHEGQPLVVNNTLYVVTPFPNNLIALDLTKPGFPQKWIFRPNPDIRSVGIACCDIVNRGASFADGKIIYNTLDAHTVAVDANTGKEVWRTAVGDIKIGETTTMAPVVVRHMVYAGISGGELGVRGRLIAMDVKSGKSCGERGTAIPTRTPSSVRISNRSTQRIKARIWGLRHGRQVSGSSVAVRYGVGFHTTPS